MLLSLSFDDHKPIAQLSTPSQRHCRGSLRGMFLLRGAYAGLCGVGFAYTAMASFCFRLRPEVLEPQAENISTNQCKTNQFQLLPTSVYTKRTRCRLKPAYTKAYTTYAVCVGAYVWGIICLPLYLFSCIQRKENSLILLLIKSQMLQQDSENH